MKADDGGGDGEMVGWRCCRITATFSTMPLLGSIGSVTCAKRV
jgi:hypothetical protein